ncbi:MAG: hypothetical protein NTU53_23850 [Planctomycetota bacterium]|nr:hypothetical protein [Planctomycetota bacterium]
MRQRSIDSTHAVGRMGHSGVEIRLVVFVDPKQSLRLSEYRLELKEAVDDKRNSLLKPPRTNSGIENRFTGDAIRRDLMIWLNESPEIGKTIARLKGTVHCPLPTKSERWEIPDVLDVKGISKATGAARYSIQRVTKTPEGTYEVRLIVEPGSFPANRTPTADFATMRRAMRLVDAEGRAYNMGGCSEGGDEPTKDYRYNFNRFGGEARIGQPAKLLSDNRQGRYQVAVAREK